MIKLGSAVLLLTSSAGAAAGGATDFGVRLVPTESGTKLVPVRVESTTAIQVDRSSLSKAVVIAARMGRVTSTYRSPARNRLVGGVRNSFHLSGRAIDVVPRYGVRHRDIETALVNAGYRLRESLDEGDHSHFAFDTGRAPARRPAALAPAAQASVGTSWKVVYAPSARSR